MRIYFILLAFYSVASCNTSDHIFITDENYYETERHYSPDKTKMLLTYGTDEGAMGDGVVGTAVLRLSDTLKDILPYTIPWYVYQECKWLGNDTVVVYTDYLKKMRLDSAGRQIYNNKFSINEVQIKYDWKDLLDSSYVIDTLFNEISPNNQYRAVAYRYTSDKAKDSFLNISVINSSGSLPKYGNYLISDINNDYVYGCEWDESNELVLYTTNSSKNEVDNCLVKNQWDFPYKIIIDDNKSVRSSWENEKNGY